MTYKTGKRDEILDFLSKNHESSFSLLEICNAIVSDGHGKSTVYRIVSELLNDGCIKKITDGKTRHCTYQYIGDEECRGHLHLKCRGCGKLYHLDHELSDELSKTLRESGFSLDDGAMLFGKCNSCSNEKVKEDKNNA